MPRHTPSVEDALIEAVLALVARRAGHTSGAIRIRIDSENGWEWRTKITGERTLPPQRPEPEPEQSTLTVGIASEIIRTLTEVGHRLTTTGLMQEMGRRNFLCSEGKLKAALSILVECGQLTNEQRGSQRGYGLPEWTRTDSPE